MGFKRECVIKGYAMITNICRWCFHFFRLHLHQYCVIYISLSTYRQQTIQFHLLIYTWYLCALLSTYPLQNANKLVIHFIIQGLSVIITNSYRLPTKRIMRTSIQRAWLTNANNEFFIIFLSMLALLSQNTCISRGLYYSLFVDLIAYVVHTTDCVA